MYGGGDFSAFGREGGGAGACVQLINKAKKIDKDNFNFNAFSLLVNSHKN